MNDRTNGSPGDPRGAPPGSSRPGAPGSPPIRGGQPTDQPSGAPGRTRAEERIAALGEAPAGLAQEVERLRAELAEAQRVAEEARAAWQRSAADFANYKRRSEQERADQAGLASEALLLKVLAIADDLDLAIEHVPAEAAGSPWVEGISAIDRKLRQVLESAGVTPLDTLGKPFDPHEQQAISHEETTEAPDGTVLRELKRGYRVRDRILRPALVAVARNESTGPHASNET